MYEKYIEIGGQLWREEELGRCLACNDDQYDTGLDETTRYEYVLPDPAKPFSAGFARHPYLVYDIVYEGESGMPSLGPPHVYDDGDPVWRIFGVAPGNSAQLAPLLQQYNDEYVSRARRSFNVVEVTHERVEKTERLNAGVQGRILSGGDMSVKSAALLNDNSQVIAGGILSFKGASITNTQAFGSVTSKVSGIRHKSFVTYDPNQLVLDWGGSDQYVGVSQRPSTPIGVSEQVANRVPVGSGKQVTAVTRTFELAMRRRGSSRSSIGIGWTRSLRLRCRLRGR